MPYLTSHSQPSLCRTELLQKQPVRQPLRSESARLCHVEMLSECWFGQADKGRAEGIASLRAAYEAAVEEREAARLRSDEW